jgi:hypothetical protein
MRASVDTGTINIDNAFRRIRVVSNLSAQPTSSESTRIHVSTHQQSNEA